MTESQNTNDRDQRKIVAFRLGKEEYGVDIMAVREIRSWTATTALPKAPHYVRGVINLRGAVLPIVDLGLRLGMLGTDDKPSNVIIVIESQARLIGLLVDAVSDILTVGKDKFLPTPSIPSATVQQFIECVASIDDRMIQLVASDQILEHQIESAA
ncbi:MAG: chemotaxis protein CheW [Pseudomonadota bacterium]